MPPPAGTLTKRNSSSVLDTVDLGCASPLSPRRNNSPRRSPLRKNSPQGSSNNLSDWLWSSSGVVTLPTVLKVLLALVLLELARHSLAVGPPAAKGPHWGGGSGSDYQHGTFGQVLRSVNKEDSAAQASPKPGVGALERLRRYLPRPRRHNAQPLRMVVVHEGRGLGLAEQQAMGRRHRRLLPDLPSGQRAAADSSSEIAAGSSGSGGATQYADTEAAVQLRQQQQERPAMTVLSEELRQQLLAEEEELMAQQQALYASRRRARQQTHKPLAEYLAEGGRADVDVIDDCDDEDGYGCGEDDLSPLEVYDEDYSDYDSSEGGVSGVAAGSQDTQLAGALPAAGTVSAAAAAGAGGVVESSLDTLRVVESGSGQQGQQAAAAAAASGGSSIAASGATAPQYVQRPRRSYDRKRWLSFSVCNGLTNQRIALLSAALLAVETQRTLLLPRLLVNGTQVRDSEVNEWNAPSCGFEEIMDAQAFADALDKVGLTVEKPGFETPAPAARLDLAKGNVLEQLESVDQQEHIYVTCPLLRVPPGMFLQYEALVWAALEGMRPAEPLRRAADQVEAKLREQAKAEAYNVLHLRLGHDWTENCHELKALGKPCHDKTYMVGTQLRRAGVRQDLPLLLVLDRDALQLSQYQNAVRSLKDKGYHPFVLKDLAGAHFTREQAAMVSYYLGQRADQFVGNAMSTFSALLIMERLHTGRFAAYYNGGHKIPLADFVPLYQASHRAGMIMQC
ncbi:hypothetical protein N2152v2_007937 [Parachlorella kessleri]